MDVSAKLFAHRSDGHCRWPLSPWMNIAVASDVVASWVFTPISEGKVFNKISATWHKATLPRFNSGR